MAATHWLSAFRLQKALSALVYLVLMSSPLKLKLGVIFFPDMSAALFKGGKGCLILCYEFLRVYLHWLLLGSCLKHLQGLNNLSEG